jgi:hypothetical protein
MGLFKTKTRKLEERIESLEGELGLFYHVDSDGYVDHKEEKDGNWRSVLARLTKLEEAEKEEKSSQLLGKGGK